MSALDNPWLIAAICAVSFGIAINQLARAWPIIRDFIMLRHTSWHKSNLRQWTAIARISDHIAEEINLQGQPSKKWKKALFGYFSGFDDFPKFKDQDLWYREENNLDENYRKKN